ncbi:MAG TPA: DUF3048 domain-containing protein [Candidatus Moranbacteria bacterium]|nr:DUF3048 domain-containing protein [Candidatus Moranbacteria bacterium]
MTKKQKIMVAIVAILLAGIIVYFISSRDSIRKNRITQIKAENKQNVENTTTEKPLNDKNVSPISGLACDNWNRRALAVMQPSDVPARPAAGFSQADMVIEMPVITASVTRLMAIYICNTPKEVGSMRSARHDFIHLAKGLDAIFASWGRSESHDKDDKIGLAKGILDRKEIENINCNGDAGVSAHACSTNPCFRKDGFKRGVDSGYAHPQEFLNCAKELGYKMTNDFVGYPHQAEAPLDQRPKGGHLRVAFAGPFAVGYDYDRDTNSYLRIWGGKNDFDRNNKKRIAPKNIVVMIAKSEQIAGQYNNVQLGDPWYDTSDTGEAHYYMNGKEYRGTWKKDKSNIASKLFFYDENGEEVKFVPGQIWVEILEPGQALKWSKSSLSKLTE